MKVCPRTIVTGFATLALICCVALFLGAPQSHSNDAALLQQISDYEVTAQKMLEDMVVAKAVDTRVVKEQVAIFASQLDTLSPDNAEIASAMLAEILEAVTLVEVRTVNS